MFDKIKNVYFLNEALNKHKWNCVFYSNVGGQALETSSFNDSGILKNTKSKIKYRNPKRYKIKDKISLMFSFQHENNVSNKRNCSGDLNTGQTLYSNGCKQVWFVNGAQQVKPAVFT